MFHIKSFTFNLVRENTYLLYNDKKNAWLIDPGNMNQQENEKIENFIKEEGLNITKILLTHAHFDHILGLQWAVDTFSLPVHLHQEEEEILERLPMSVGRFGFAVPPVKAELKFINEGETLDFDGETFTIFHVPGHSPGSLVFYNPNENFMISGDVLFEGSVGRTDLYKGDYDLLISGIKEKLLPLKEETKVYSGHGRPTTIGFEKNYNPFLK